MDVENPIPKRNQLPQGYGTLRPVFTIPLNRGGEGVRWTVSGHRSRWCEVHLIGVPYET